MARTPEEIDPEFMEAMNAGNAEALLAFYEPGATFVFPTGDVAEGVEAIGQAMKELLALHPRLDLRTKRVVRAGDTALVHSTFTVKGTAPDGSTIEMAGSRAIVIRQQPDGTWRMVIDDPGWASG